MLWDADNESDFVYEVLSNQSCGAARGKDGAVAFELQTAGGWRPMQKLHTLEPQVFDRVSRGWDTRGGGAVFREGG